MTYAISVAQHVSFIVDIFILPWQILDSCTLIDIKERVLRIMLSIFKNYVLVCALVGWCAAQTIKILTGVFQNQKVNLIKLLVSTGGMPSSHSAMVSALCTASGIKYGVISFQFAVTFVLAMVVMRDAAGIRREVGKQATVINKMAKDSVEWPFENIDLNELVGHSPFQVLIGLFVGVASAFSIIPLFR